MHPKRSASGAYLHRRFQRDRDPRKGGIGEGDSTDGQGQDPDHRAELPRDFLESLTDDPETRIIGLYIEGSKNGTRLKTALSKAASQKPLIVIKGGMTEHGIRAASSHTASMAGTPEMWRSLFQQAGAIQGA